MAMAGERERLRHYNARSVQERIAILRKEEPAAEEIASIEQGSKEFRKGRFTDSSQLRHELGRRRRQPRPKKSPARSRR